MLITIHRRMPCIRGFTPTDLSTSVDSDAPMKNIVRVRQRRAIPDMTMPTAGMLSSTNVLRRMAIMKKRMNHGIVIFLSWLLNMKDVARARGMIHKALVSLMVVATFRASSP